MPDPSRWRSLLRDEQDEARVQQMWEKIRREQAPLAAPFRRAWWRLPKPALVAAATAVFLASVVGVLIVVPQFITEGAAGGAAGNETSALRLGDEALPRNLAPDRTHVFSDASEIHTEPNSRLDVLESTGRSVKLALRSGNAFFSITPGGPRRWQIICGGVTVEVVGTKFHVSRSAADVTVRVERGAVVVRGRHVPDRIQRLERGEVLSIAQPTPRVRNQDSGENDVIMVGEPSTTGAELHQGAGSLGSQPTNETVTERDPVGTLLARADAFRLAGRNQRAAAALESIVRSHSSDSRAALASYTLARLRLEVMGMPLQASSAFARSLSLGLSGPLAEAALAGQVEALGQAGRASQASDLAGRYLTRFPRGRYRETVQRWR